MRGVIAKVVLLGSIGQGRAPVESLRLWYGWVVVVIGVPCAPTARLCPVPMTPAQSHGRAMTAAPPPPDPPAPGWPPVDVPASVAPAPPPVCEPSTPAWPLPPRAARDPPHPNAVAPTRAQVIKGPECVLMLGPQ